MADWGGDLTDKSSARAATADAAPTYRRIAVVLRDSIAAGGLAPGTVLLEGPLSTHFGTSRAPVRQALSLLEAEGLVKRFDGRGLIVPGAEPLRGRIDLARLVPVQPTAERHAAYYALERQLVLHSLIGPARLNELGLTRSLGVGRAVTRELLLTAERTGIVARDPRGAWQLVPLTAERMDNLYALRELVEPAAVACVEPDTALIDRMLRNLADAGAQPDPAPDMLDRLEIELHVELLALARNRELSEALLRTRPLLFAGKHMQQALGRIPDSYVAEHSAVLERLRRHDAPQAAKHLRAHLSESRRKARDRLNAYRAITDREDLPDWLQPV